MGSFALGHAAYGCAFYVRGIELVSVAVAFALMVIVVGLSLRWLGPRLPIDMRVPMRIYMTVIATMVACAIAASVEANEPLLTAGALAFAISDLAVARERFVQPGMINQLWGLPLYYGAQLLLAWSCVFARL